MENQYDMFSYLPVEESGQEVKNNMCLPSRCIWTWHKTNWTWSSFCRLFLTDSVCRVKVSSKDWCWMCADTEMFLLLYPAGLCACSVSLCLWLQASEPATVSFTPSPSWCSVVCAVVCVCVCCVVGLEGWQKSSSDGIQLCSAAVADASRGECFPSERANSKDWSTRLPRCPFSPSFF